MNTKRIFFSSVLSLAAIFFAGVFSGCSKASSAQDLGRAAFNGYGCATCHRVAGFGGKLGPDLTTVGFRKSPEWLDLWLKDPSHWKKNTLMPNFYLPEETRKNLVAYLGSLKGEAYRNNPPWDAPSVKDDSVQRGKVLFEHVGCVGCHGVEGRGNYPNNNVVGGLIPTLTRVADGYSKEELKEKLRKGVPQSEKADPNLPAPMIHMPAWGEYLKDDELDALVDYLYSLRPAPAAGEAW